MILVPGVSIISIIARQTVSVSEILVPVAMAENVKICSSTNFG